MARKAQFVEITTEYLVEWDGEDYYVAHPTTQEGEDDPLKRAIDMAVDLDDWEDVVDD